MCQPPNAQNSLAALVKHHTLVPANNSNPFNTKPISPQLIVCTGLVVLSITLEHKNNLSSTVGSHWLAECMNKESVQ